MNLPNGFAHGIQGPNGRRLHYVTGGSGDPVLLVAAGRRPGTSGA